MRARISEREQRTIAASVAVSALALIFAFVVLPYVRQQADREQLIRLQGDKLARLTKVVADSRATPLAVMASDDWLAARSPALAASALQSVLRAYADQTGMVISELDVAGKADTTGSMVMIPATISAIGELRSVTGFLSYIEHGPVRLQVRELSLRPNPALKGNLLQMTTVLAAPYLTKDEDTSRRLALQGLHLPASYSPPRFERNVFSARVEQTVTAPIASAVPTTSALQPVLYGTMMGAQPTALMRLDASGTQVYREGDVGGSYRVIKISESAVELRGPSGRTVLRLQP